MGKRKRENNSPNTLVVDVTYKCNSRCLYCQWGAINPDLPEINLKDILIPKSTLAHLGTQRVVLSGGEPLLHQELEKIVSYYREVGIDQIVTLTNGLRLTQNRLSQLISNGLTGITLSIDGLTPSIAKKARGLREEQHKTVMKNLRETIDTTSEMEFEIGINVVVSRANLEIDAIREILDFAEINNLSFVKFQPVFNDGYVADNAPQLILQPNDAQQIRKIGRELIPNVDVRTNQVQFWEDVASTLEGVPLKGGRCGIDAKTAIAIRGDLKFCFWVNFPIYGKSDDYLTLDVIEDQQNKFQDIKSECSTGMYCFCLQRMEHTW